MEASLQEDLNTFIERNIKPQSIILAEGWSGSHILATKGYGKNLILTVIHFHILKKLVKN